VYLPEDVRQNKLAPKAELMVFLGFPAGTKGFLFMRLHNNSLFTGATATFDEAMFPKCPKQNKNEVTPLGDKIPTDNEEPHIPLEDDGDDDFPPHTRRSPSPDNQDLASKHDGDKTASPPHTPPRQEQELPPAQRQPPPPPRKSGRERKVPTRPGNVYGEKRNPVDIKREIGRVPGRETKGKTRQVSTPVPRSGEQQTQVPGPSAPAVPENDYRDPSLDNPEEEQLVKLAQEGGVEFIEYLLAQALPYNSSLPSKSNPREWTFRDIMRLPIADQKEWKTACQEELDSLRKRKVYELVELPPNRKAIKNRWVFDVKTDGRKKARLVAKGFSQIEGIDYDEIFSPVVRFETVRLVFALAALESWHVSALDVKTAFLYGKLDEEIYMEQPEGFKIKGQERKVLRLRRAIYGLKQAALAWWRELAASLKELGFTRLYSDAGLFIARHTDGVFVIIVAYVDDILFAGPNKSAIASKKQLFMTKWECRDLGDCHEFLRMRITRKGRSILLDQCS